MVRPEDGLQVGQTVYTVGSFAGGTTAPALQKTTIKTVENNGYDITLEEGTWQGHSGGPVVTVETENSPPKLVGPVWGYRGTKPGISLVTGPQAMHDLLKQMQLAGTAQYSVKDSPTLDTKTAVQTRVPVYVYGSNVSLDADLTSRPKMTSFFEFIYTDQPHLQGKKTPFVWWTDKKGTVRYIEGLKSAEDL